MTRSVAELSGLIVDRMGDRSERRANGDLVTELISAVMTEAPRRAELDTHGPTSWLVVINREGHTLAIPFDGEAAARTYFEQASLQWSDSYLCEVRRGPLA